MSQRFQARAPGRASGAFVTFEPGARTDWHTHPLGQTLIVTSGVGRVQRWGDPVEEIRPGDIVWTPAGQKHWHGASPTEAMTHIAIGERLDGKSVDWMENVTDEQYAAPIRTQPAAAAAPDAAPADQPTRARPGPGLAGCEPLRRDVASAAGGSRRAANLVAEPSRVPRVLPAALEEPAALLALAGHVAAVFLDGPVLLGRQTRGGVELAGHLREGRLHLRVEWLQGRRRVAFQIGQPRSGLGSSFTAITPVRVTRQAQPAG